MARLHRSNVDLADGDDAHALDLLAEAADFLQAIGNPMYLPPIG